VSSKEVDGATPLPRRDRAFVEPGGRCGWSGDFPRFESTPVGHIRASLSEFVADASDEQIRAWDDSIPPLQTEVGEVVAAEPRARVYSALLEYELPYESRRPDVVLLVSGAVVVLALKGRSTASQADIDQVAAYARDLRNYHRECEERSVHAVLVPTRARTYLGQECGVHVVGPDGLDALIAQLDRAHEVPPLDPIPVDRFLEPGAYWPLPTIVSAARHLFRHRALPRIKRAHACTQPALDALTRIVHDAHTAKGRRLVLLSGIPGSGKTLVGLQIVHAEFLDDLAVPRAGGAPTAPAVYSRETARSSKSSSTSCAGRGAARMARRSCAG
jgi:hypothetical protein